jgi:hypothetical protein
MRDSQVETFVVGDLVYFTGYEVENPPEAHRVGVVVGVPTDDPLFQVYQVLWFKSNVVVGVSPKHLELAYTKNV